ncbi:MAG: bifunctional folylpolyglutamate synthase/dihydrofolate synthase, partial [Christensenellales bacterium]
TNGKGSVAEYLSFILTAAWERCGCYTSPHLVSYTERMRIGNEYINETELNALLKEVKENKLAVNETLFAAYTAAAMLWFSRKKADYAVIETGLGGRLDPTVCVEPTVTVLTPIDYDHTDLLGNDLRLIAKEKCGIIKPEVSVISAKQYAEVEAVIVGHCKKMRSPVLFTPPVKIIESTLKGQVFDFEGDRYAIRSIGQIQPENAALAILAAKTLGIDTGSIKAGLMYTRLRCRTQYVMGEPDMVIDGGHNPASIDMLLRTLQEHFKGRKMVLLFGCMKDKDYKTIISMLGGFFSNVYITCVDKKRGASTEELNKYFNAFKVCSMEDDPIRAFEKAKETAIKTTSLLVVCGSFYLAGLVPGIISTKN